VRGEQSRDYELLMNIAADAAKQRAAGERPSRMRSAVTAALVGGTAAVMTYRLLRREPST
jgi:hypothetical protein